MPVALNLSSLAETGLEARLSAAAAAGFEIVELRAPDLVAGADAPARLSAHGLRAWSLNSLEGAGEADLGEAARRLGAQAAACGAPYVVCVPGRRRDGLEDALGKLSELCASEGSELAFEFMGFRWSAVRSLHEALAVHPGPVVIDTFHWALGDGDLDELGRLDPGRLAAVHVNDAPSTELERLGDADRVLPGDGVLDLDGFCATLRAIGFAGVWSLELFAPVDAPRARAAMRRFET